MYKKFKNVYIAHSQRFVKLSKNEELSKCTGITYEILALFFSNVNYIMKKRKLTYYRMVEYYKLKDIKVNKAYIYSLSKLNKYKSCNILILAFVANYLGIPLIELLTKNFTLDDARTKGDVENINSF